MKLIEKIREIRSKKNISQEYLAMVLGIDTSNYHRLEKGISPLSVDRLETISNALEMHLIDLFCYGEPSLRRKSDIENESLIKHLTEEILFLRQQLQEKELQINKVIYLQEKLSFLPPAT